MIKMLRSLVLLSVLACTLGRSAIQYSDTTQLQAVQTLFLNKMYIHDKGFVKIFVELTDIKYLEEATGEKLNNSLWLYVLPRDQVGSLRGLPCLQAMTQITNKLPIRYNTLLNLTLQQDRPEMFLAYLGFCPEEPSFKLNFHRFGVFSELKQDRSHLERYELWIAFKSILRFLASWYLIVNAHMPYRADPFAYGPLFMLGCSMVGAASQLLEVFYHKVVGHNYYFISDLPHFFSIIAQQIVFFNFLAICCGWRTLGSRGDVADLVAPFVICYGATQLIMRLLYNYSQELPDLDSYYGSVYYTIEVVCAMIVFWFGWINVQILKNRHEEMRKEQISRVVTIGFLLILAVTFTRKISDYGLFTILADLAEIGLEVLFIGLLLKGFLRKQEKPIQNTDADKPLITLQNRPKNQ